MPCRQLITEPGSLQIGPYDPIQVSLGFIEDADSIHNARSINQDVGDNPLGLDAFERVCDLRSRPDVDLEDHRLAAEIWGCKGSTCNMRQAE